jgi:protein-S-isoprenylcysteine O-methyltransferase Ste14
MLPHLIPQIALGIWVIWIVFYWRGGQRIAADVIRSVKTTGFGEDTLALLVLVAASALFLLTGLLNATGLLRANGSTALHFVGLLLILVGTLGTFYSRHYLGRMWTAEATVRKNHEIVRSGPYATVRHPIYTFAVILYIGTALVFCHWWTLIAASMAFYAYVVKARGEDRLLQESLPGYLQYTELVPHRLVPGLW